jgi:aerobic carbon-monoxide dehydrogenase large subunit
VTPCASNRLGVKGCGKAGAIAAPAALINPITDVLGVKQFDMPATPEKCGRPFGPPPREFQTYWSQ